MRELPKFITNPDSSVYLTRNAVCIDIETTNLGKGDARFSNRVVCYAYTDISTDVINYVDSDIDTNLPALIAEVVEAGKFLIMHGGKFEVKHFIKMGIDVSSLLVYDTLLSEKIILSNRSGALSLDAVHKRYGGRGKAPLVDKLIKGGVCPSTIPASMLKARVCKDVQDTLEVFDKQVKVLEENGLLNVAYTKSIFMPVVADMEMRGMHLDSDVVYSIYTTVNKELNSLHQRLDDLTGGINMASPKQKSEFIYGTLGFEVPKRFGQPLMGKWGGKTDEPTLQLLKAKTATQIEFLKLVFQEAKARVQVSNFLNRFVKACESGGSMIYGSINQEITATQRLSSSNPNIQNIDRLLKKCFNPRNDGWKIRQNDYSQLEFRGAGILAECPVVLKAVVDGVDVHAVTAAEMFTDFSTADPEKRAVLRTAAKSRTFKPLYGGTSGTDKEVRYYKRFLEIYTGVSDWHRRIMAEAAHTGRVVCPTGLIFYFPHTRYREDGLVTNHTKIKNYPVQYFATGELAVIGCLLLWHMMKAYEVQSFIINEVHDSVVIEEHPDEHELMEDLSHRAMVDETLKYIDNLYNIKFDMPIEIETEITSHWSYDINE